MEDRKPTRRQWLRGVAGVAALGGAAGCMDGDDTQQGTSTTTATETDQPTATPTTTEAQSTTAEPTATDTGPEPLEVLHAWSGGDGKDAFAALVEGFRDAHPEVAFAGEPVEGAVRVSLGTAVRNRVQSGDVPSTWQAWPGADLRPYREDLGDIGDAVWAATDMVSAYGEGPTRAARLDGTFVAVPIDVHRVNNLFYNRAVLDDAGVDPEAIGTPAELTDALATVAAETDAVPLAHQTRAPWSTVQLWETVLLGHAGPGAYRSLVAGDPDRAAIRRSLETLRDYADHYPVDAASISGPAANARLIEGEAAFIHQGDWAASAYEPATGFAYGEDWGHVPFPGTAGHYLQVMDSFTYPARNPSPEATKTFLRYCGTADAQARFNGPKGAVPPRTDVDVSGFSAFQREQYDDYRSAEAHLPSVQHGLAIPPGPRTAVATAFADFLATRDVEATTAALLETFRGIPSADD